MENAITVFEHPQFGEVRTVEIDGEPWFVAADVCRALDLSNPTMALGRLDEDERSKLSIGRQGETGIVNEPGLYGLVLGSRKEEAKSFKRWVKHDVLPAIRRTGTYTVAPPKVLTPAEMFLQQAQAMVEQERKVNALAARMDEQ
ncbi:MAG: BRO-N domain-containing protein, partial [bacterium]